MVNEAVEVENAGTVTDYTVADVGAVTKGTLMKLVDPRTASGAGIGRADRFAGIASAAKVTSDGATNLALWKSGIFKLTAASGATILAGDYVCMSGANLVEDASIANLLSGAVVGKALEDFDGTGADSTGEVELI